jgi:hypothetical protein
VIPSELDGNRERGAGGEAGCELQCIIVAVLRQLLVLRRLVWRHSSLDLRKNTRPRYTLVLCLAAAARMVCEARNDRAPEDHPQTKRNVLRFRSIVGR